MFLLSFNQCNIFLFFNSFLVPIPPGIISISKDGQFLIVKLLFTLSPPVAEIYFFFSEKVKTLKAGGRFSIDALLFSESLALEKTS